MIWGVSTDPTTPSDSGALVITSPDGYDHLVDDAVLAHSFDGRFLAHCGAVVVSASMADCPGRACSWCFPAHWSRPPGRRDLFKWWLVLRSLCRAVVRVKAGVDGDVAERHRWVPVGEGVFATITAAAAEGSGGADLWAVSRSALTPLGPDVASSATSSAISQDVREVNVP